MNPWRILSGCTECYVWVDYISGREYGNRAQAARSHNQTSCLRLPARYRTIKTALVFFFHVLKESWSSSRPRHEACHPVSFAAVLGICIGVQVWGSFAHFFVYGALVALLDWSPNDLPHLRNSLFAELYHTIFHGKFSRHAARARYSALDLHRVSHCEEGLCTLATWTQTVSASLYALHMHNSIWSKYLYYYTYSYVLKSVSYKTVFHPLRCNKDIERLLMCLLQGCISRSFIWSTIL